MSQVIEQIIAGTALKICEQKLDKIKYLLDTPYPQASEVIQVLEKQINFKVDNVYFIRKDEIVAILSAFIDLATETKSYVMLEVLVGLYDTIKHIGGKG